MTDLQFFQESLQFFLSCHVGDYNNTDDSSKVISMVPSRLRDLSPKSFDPRMVSIGPLHHKDEKLKKGEGLKRTYMLDLLLRFDLPLKEMIKACLRTIYDSIPKIRECYVEMESYSNIELARMMVTDACFILEFCIKLSENKVNVLRAQSIFVDLLLVENQVPVFVLNDIFKYFTIFKSHSDEAISIAIETSLTDHILPILEFGKLFDLKLQLSHNSTNHNHILGLLHACYLPTDVDESILSGYDPEIMHNVVELDKAGVKFKPNKGNESWPMTMKVKRPCCGWFSCFWGRPTLTMPELLITEFTELKLRNLIAYEQKCVHHYVASYAMALDMIVDSEEDIAILVKSKVMINAVGSNEEAGKMVNNICKEVAISDFFYIKQWKELHVYCNSYWPRNIAWLKRTYFNNPWNIIALLAGIMLFALTTVQTYFTAVQTCFSDSKK